MITIAYSAVTAPRSPASIPASRSFSEEAPCAALSEARFVRLSAATGRPGLHAWCTQWVEGSPVFLFGSGSCSGTSVNWWATVLPSLSCTARRTPVGPMLPPASDAWMVCTVKSVPVCSDTHCERRSTTLQSRVRRAWRTTPAAPRVQQRRGARRRLTERGRECRVAQPSVADRRAL